MGHLTLRALVGCSFLVCGFVSAVEMSPSTSAEKAPAVIDSGDPVAPSRYFALFGSYQALDNDVKWSHSFAVFVRAVESDQPGGLRVAEHCTISWLPQSNEVSLVRPAEPGVNKSLAETLALAEANKLDMRFEGPFETSAELFRRAVAQVERLNRGELRYKCMDRYTRATAKNCMHAISDLVEENGRLSTFTQRGHEATPLVIHHLREHLLKPEPVPAGVAAPLLAAVNLNRFRNPAAEPDMEKLASGPNR